MMNRRPPEAGGQKPTYKLVVIGEGGVGCAFFKNFSILDYFRKVITDYPIFPGIINFST